MKMEDTELQNKPTFKFTITNSSSLKKTVKLFNWRCYKEGLMIDEIDDLTLECSDKEYFFKLCSDLNMLSDSYIDIYKIKAISTNQFQINKKIANIVIDDTSSINFIPIHHNQYLAISQNKCIFNNIRIPLIPSHSLDVNIEPHTTLFLDFYLRKTTTTTTIEKLNNNVN